MAKGGGGGSEDLPILLVLMGCRTLTLALSPLLEAFPILSTACTSDSANGYDTSATTTS